MPILDDRHDLGHPIEHDDAWSESYYFNGYAPDSDTGLFTRIGIRPNEGTMDVGFSIWLPDGGLAEYHHREPCDPRAVAALLAAPLEVGAVRYERLQPMARWRLTMEAEVPARSCASGDGPTRSVQVACDLEFDAITPPIGTDGEHGGGPRSPEAAASARSVGRGHFEQAGAWHGWLAVDGERFAWTDALGNRDNSWGPRRWGGPRMWRWFSINVDRSLHFGGIRLGTDAGDLHRGWVYDDGRMASVAAWTLHTELADDAVTQRVLHLEVLDKTGRTYPLRGEVLRVADIGRAGGTMINEGLTRWRCDGPDGDRVGYGIAEYLHQLDDTGRPLVPVA